MAGPCSVASFGDDDDLLYSTSGGGMTPCQGGADSRDPLASAPLFTAEQCELTGKARRQSDGAAFFDLPIKLRANLTLQALQALNRGVLRGLGRYALATGSDAEWAAAGRLPVATTERVEAAHQAAAPPETRPRGADALAMFQRPSRGGAAPTPPTGKPKPRSAGPPRRGDVCRACVDQIALPPAGSVTVPMTAVSPRARRFLEDHQNLMLAADGDERARASGIEPYIDPALKSRRAMTKLACRLWASGMLNWVYEILGEVAPFTVVKTVEAVGGSSSQGGMPREEIVAQRMVLDQRRENLRWKRPPWFPMSNAACFPFLEVPDKDSADVAAFTGDAPDWYWTLGIPAEMWPHFCVPLVKPSDLRNALRSLGIEVEVPEGAVAVALVAPVMGWSWAVILAHWCLEDLLLHTVEEFKTSNRISFRIPLPQPHREDMIHWEYIDDVGGIVIRPRRGRSTAEADARALGAKIREAFRDEGFGYHKDEYGPQVVSLGHELEPQGFGVRLARMTVAATEQLFHQKIATAEALEAAEPKAQDP